MLTSQGVLPPTDKAVLVYTDGGCDQKLYGVGAWSFVVVPPGKPIEAASYSCGGLRGTTNNRMELMAVLHALTMLEIGPRTIITTDSEYAIKGATLWANGWAKNGWKTQAGQPVKNRDLWERLVILVELHNVRFDWVKGHSGNPLNEMCDKLCTDTMTQLKQNIGKGWEVEADDYGHQGGIQL